MFRRIILFAFAALAAVYLFWTVALIALRTVNPPTTGVQIQRRIEAWVHGARYRKRYTFVPLSKISPEMHAPKLAWLARCKPETTAKAGHFFDLTDFLSFRATGSLTRSACPAACKFGYLAHEPRSTEHVDDVYRLRHVGQAWVRRLTEQFGDLRVDREHAQSTAL